MRHLLAPGPCLIEILSVKNYFCAMTSNGFDFYRIGVFGNKNDRAHSKDPRCRGNRLSVIACGSCYDSGLAFMIGKMRNQIDSAADLEGANRLVVLVLHID